MVTSFLYICDGVSIHDKNFIDSLSFRANVELLNVSEPSFSRPAELIHSLNPKVIIVTPIGPLIDVIPEDYTGSVIGISLAFDLNEVKTKTEHSETITRLKRLDGIVVDSLYTKRKLLEEFGYQGSVCQIIYGLRNPLMNYPLQEHHKLNRLIVTRTWTRLHNNELILEAFLSIPPEFALTVGFLEPQNPYRQITNNERIHLESVGVEFLKPMINEDLQKTLMNYGVYVSASISDGSSISLLEAMNSKRICLVSDFPTNKEIITNGENGFLFQNGNKESLAENIINIQSLTPQEAECIGNNARQRVNEIADWEKHSTALVEFCLTFEEKIK